MAFQKGVIKSMLVIINYYMIIWGAVDIVLAFIIPARDIAMMEDFRRTDPVSSHLVFHQDLPITIGVFKMMAGVMDWCVGAHRCCTLVYVTLIVVNIILILVVICNLIFVKQQECYLNGSFLEWIEQYGTNETIAETVDMIQSKYRCCGENGFRDWGDDFPESCCEMGMYICEQAEVFKDGCKRVICGVAWASFDLLVEQSISLVIHLVALGLVATLIWHYRLKKIHP